jgi:hypothetical protein
MMYGYWLLMTDMYFNSIAWWHHLVTWLRYTWILKGHLGKENWKMRRALLYRALSWLLALSAHAGADRYDCVLSGAVQGELRYHIG